MHVSIAEPEFFPDQVPSRGSGTAHDLLTPAASCMRCTRVAMMLCGRRGVAPSVVNVVDSGREEGPVPAGGRVEFRRVLDRGREGLIPGIPSVRTIRLGDFFLRRFRNRTGDRDRSD